MMQYKDFDLLLEHIEEQKYKVYVINSPEGRAEAVCNLSFIDLGFDNFLSSVHPRQSTDGLNASVRKIAETFGGNLFDAVFGDEVRRCFHQSFEKIPSGYGLRLRLDLSKAPGLAILPWEYMYDTANRRFLSLTVETPIVRYLKPPKDAKDREPLPMSPPLRVLVMISSPSNYTPIDVDQEWNSLNEAFAELQKNKLVELTRLERATLPELQKQLQPRKEGYHIFHFIGHGGFDTEKQDGFMVMEDKAGLGRLVSGIQLGTLLYDEPTLRLVVLNTCESGRSSHEDPFAGLAQSLVRQGIPAVVAMQFQITDEAAIKFTEEFYSPIAKNDFPVDAALAEARKALFVDDENRVEWGTPVLFMRSSDGRIFDMKQPNEKMPVTRENPLILFEKEKVESTFTDRPQQPLPSIPRHKKSFSLVTASATIVLSIFLIALLWYFKTRPPKDISALPADKKISEMKYMNFDLFIDRLGNRQYRARILPPLSGQVITDFTLPFDSLQLENFLLKVGRPRRGIRNVRSPEMDAVKNFGSKLFNSVFTEKVKYCLRQSLDEAKDQECGLRLRLRLTNVPELADLPWEYLYYNTDDVNLIFSLSTKTPIVRYLELPEAIRPLGVEPPLRILVMISNPHDYPQLDAAQEWAKLNEAFKELQHRKFVKLERLGKATLYDLQHQLQNNNYHIFHFIGHGGFDKKTQQGVLIMEDDQGRGREVSSQDMGVMLHDADKLRLVLLNACEGARSSRDDPFAGIAQSLVQQGIPAVIAMQFEVTDAAAITLANEFYTALTSGYPVDAALAEARKAIFTQNNDIEWGTPALYMRSPDGRIFDIKP